MAGRGGGRVYISSHSQRRQPRHSGRGERHSHSGAGRGGVVRANRDLDRRSGPAGATHERSSVDQSGERWAGLGDVVSGVRCR